MAELTPQHLRELADGLANQNHEAERVARLMGTSHAMYEALQEACTSLVIASDQIREAAKSDSRWTGVDEKLMRHAREGQSVLREARGEHAPEDADHA